MGTTADPVMLGYVPTSSESFLPVLGLLGNVTFTKTTGDPNPLFTIASGTIGANLVAAELDSVVVGAPLWKDASGAGSIQIGVNSLAGAGIDLPTGGSGNPDLQTLTIASIDQGFTTANLRLDNPNGGTTPDAQVELQGSIAIPDLGGLSVGVNQSNFRSHRLGRRKSDRGQSLDQRRLQRLWPDGHRHKSRARLYKHARYVLVLGQPGDLQQRWQLGQRYGIARYTEFAGLDRTVRCD